MNEPQVLDSNVSISTLDIQEFDIDLLDDGGSAMDAPGGDVGITTVTTSSWICVTITIVSVSATAVYDCLEAGD